METQGDLLSDETFSITVVLTIVCHSLYFGGRFDEIQVALDHVLGYPIYTHEMAERSLWVRAAQNIINQQPGFAPFRHLAGRHENPPDPPRNVPPALVEAILTAARARYGERVTLKRGSCTRTEDPITSARRIMGVPR